MEDMPDHAAWHTVDVGKGDIVKLLGRATSDRSGYQIHLTDLSRIWGERLSKDQIFNRAEEQRCSIDPSEDDDQYDILLNKLKGALNHEVGTTLRIHGDNDGNVLTADVTARLPGSLPLLRWTLNLQRLPATCVESELVTPLLTQVNGLKQQIQQLVVELRHKDHVISKITDRLETSGNELLTCFPSVSNVRISRKKSEREQLAQHVKGLAEFDPEVWSAHVTHRDSMQLEVQALDGIFHDLPGAAPKPPETEIQNRWWLGLEESNQHANGGEGGPSSLAAESNKISEARRVNSQTLSKRKESMQEDKFERQRTPLLLRHRGPEPQRNDRAAQPTELGCEAKASVAKDDDESTVDEVEDLDTPPPKADSRKESNDQQPNQSPVPAQRATPRKLRTVGGNHVSASPIKHSSKHSVSPEPVKFKSKSKLGKFGGKAAAKPTPEPTPPVERLPPSVSGSETPNGKSEMGTSGGKTAKKIDEEAPASAQRERSATAESTHDSSSRKPRQVEKARLPSPPCETSQERANKKRVQLKRELEEKAKAPAKKKRKF